MLLGFAAVGRLATSKEEREKRHLAKHVRRVSGNSNSHPGRRLLEISCIPP